MQLLFLLFEQCLLLGFIACDTSIILILIVNKFMLKKWDKVLFSSCPKIVPFKEYICKTDEYINQNTGSNCVFLEWYSGRVLTGHCQKIEKNMTNLWDKDPLNEVLENIRKANWWNLEIEISENYWEKTTSTTIDDFLKSNQK